MRLCLHEYVCGDVIRKIHFEVHPFQKANAIPFPSTFATSKHNCAMLLSSVDLTLLAQKTVKNSGNRFFLAVLKHTTSFLEDLVADPSLDADDFEAAEDVCTSDNLILLARHFAGEIQKPKKRKRSIETNWDKVQTILSNKAARIILTSIFLVTYLEVAMEECEDRVVKAEESEHWANDYDEVDRVELWQTRQEAIDQVKSSWEEAADAAKTMDWEAFEEALMGLEEVDA
jgi:hypothetical protein